MIFQRNIFNILRNIVQPSRPDVQLQSPSIEPSYTERQTHFYTDDTPSYISPQFESQEEIPVHTTIEDYLEAALKLLQEQDAFMNEDPLEEIEQAIFQSSHVPEIIENMDMVLPDIGDFMDDADFPEGF